MNKSVEDSRGGTYIFAFINSFITRKQKSLDNVDWSLDIVFVADAWLVTMATSDMPSIYDPFKTYGSFKWTNDLALTEKIHIFSASSTSPIIVSLRKKTFKTIIFQMNYFIKILTSKISLSIIGGYETSLGGKKDYLTLRKKSAI